MPAERTEEPALVQHLEEVRGELRVRTQALEPVSRENAQLRAGLERLQAEEAQLRLELEALRQGQPVNPPRLPETLAPPFDIKAHRTLREPLQMLFFLTVGLGLLLARAGLSAWPWVASAAGVLAVIWLVAVLTRPGWRLGASSLRTVGLLGQRHNVPFQAMREVQVLATPSQKRRGVGTLVVRCSGNRAGETSVLVRDVPEPERLAQWLRSRRVDPA